MQLIRQGNHTMSERLKKQALLLKLLASATPKMGKAIIGVADGNLIMCLCECAHNILKGNVPLTKAHLKRLKRYRADVRALVQKRSTQKRKRKILQKGGFLGALLAPVAATVLTDLIKKVT